MIGLSALTFDTAGAVSWQRDHRSRLTDLTRRVQRTATLDGGAAVVDRGYTDADRTLVLVAESPDEALVAAVERLVRTYDRLLATTREGAYEVAPQRLTLREGELALTALVAARRSA